MKSYKSLLKRAEEMLPEQSKEEARFNVPRVKGRIQGKSTRITNFKKISDYVARNPKLLLKYLSKELATKGYMDGNTAVFKGVFKSYKLNEKIKSFVDEYVKCRECGKPDTRVKKQDRIQFIKCMACGAKYPVKI